MTPEKTVAVYNEVCGPMLRARLAEGIAADDLGEEAKESNKAFVAKLQIPDQVDWGTSTINCSRARTSHIGTTHPHTALSTGHSTAPTPI